VAVDEKVANLRGRLARPQELTGSVQPVLPRVLTDRLLRFHAIDLDPERSRAAAVVPATLLAVADGDRPVTADQLGSLLDQLEAVRPPPADQDQDQLDQDQLDPHQDVTI